VNNVLCYELGQFTIGLFSSTCHTVIGEFFGASVRNCESPARSQIYFLSLYCIALLFEHLYSPRMVEEIKEEEKLEHQTNKQ